MMLAIILPLFVIMVALAVISATLSYNAALTSSKDYIHEKVLNESAKVSNFLLHHVNVAATLNKALIAGVRDKVLSRDLVNDMMLDVLAAEKEAVDVWVVFEPNAFDGLDSVSTTRPDSDEKGRYVGLAYRDGETLGIDKCYAYETDPYYLLPKETGKTFITEPIVYKVGGKDVNMVTISTPFFVDGRFKGVVGIDIAVNNLVTNNNEIKILDSGYTKILYNNGVTVAHKNIERLGQVDDALAKDNGPARLERISKGEVLTFNEYSITSKTEVFKIFVPIPVGPDNAPWILGANVPISELTKAASDLRNITFIMAIAGLLIIALISYLYIGAVTKSIGLMSHSATIVASGDLTSELDSKLLKKTDELGEMANAFSTMQHSLRDIAKEMQHVASTMNRSAAELNEVTSQAAINSEDIAKTIEEIAKGATEQAKDTESGSYKAIDLGTLIEKDLHNLKAINEEAQNVMSTLNDGKVVFGELSQKTEESHKEMVRISEGIAKTKESVDRIKGVTRLITAISDQTNLLALNASIEAARAGDAGRGFAVVAEEVRKLAEESRRSTDEIDEAVKNLTRDAENSVRIVDDLSQTIKEQGVTVDQTSERYASIISAVNIMVNGLSEMNVSAKNMENSKNTILEILSGLSAIAEENAASTEETSASSEEQTASILEIARMSEDLRRMAEEVSSISKQFKI
jgi:methyl-accepting chemotaxis protein